MPRKGPKPRGLNHDCNRKLEHPNSSRYYASHRKYGGMCQAALDAHSRSVRAFQLKKEQAEQQELMRKHEKYWTSLEELRQRFLKDGVW